MCKDKLSKAFENMDRVMEYAKTAGMVHVVRKDGFSTLLAACINLEASGTFCECAVPCTEEESATKKKRAPKKAATPTEPAEPEVPGVEEVK